MSELTATQKAAAMAKLVSELPNPSHPLPSEPDLAARLTALADAAEAYRLARPSAPGSEREAAALDIAIGRIRAALAAANPRPGWDETGTRFDDNDARPSEPDLAALRDWMRAAAAQLHDVNNHLAWEGNRPTEPPFDWTTNCQHGDCRMVRAALAANPEPGRDGLDVERLARSLALVHGGPRPWPGRLSSPQFARVLADTYRTRSSMDGRLAPDQDAPPLASGHIITDEEYREKYSPIIPDRDAPREPA